MRNVDRLDFINKLTNNRIVIKIGSSLLSDENSKDGLNIKTLKMLVNEIKTLRDQGKKVVLVSSGAVNTGRSILVNQFHRQAQSKPEVSRKQALSAIGQAPLVSWYADLFSQQNIPVAQMLITARDFQDRRAYLNMGRTLDELMLLNVLPIINENDTIATDELQFGENDLLSAACAALFKADILIVLTSVEGFLLNKIRVPHIKTISEEHKKSAGGPAGLGSGGMITKLRAGQLCQNSGIVFVILPGFYDSPILDFLKGLDIGTVIYNDQISQSIRARKKWLLFSQTQGALYVDKGASGAIIENGSSLLLAGLSSITGKFYAGEVVDILDSSNYILGRGICNYSSKQLKSILKLRKEKPVKKSEYGEIIIHRDNLVLETLK